MQLRQGNKKFRLSTAARKIGFAIVTAGLAFGFIGGCSSVYTINVNETIHVSDSPRTPLAAAITVVETIGIGDTPVTPRSPEIALIENVRITDFPGLLTSIAITITETVRVLDLPTQIPSPVQITVGVTSPRTGDIWRVGNTQSIAWATTGTGIDHVDIYYSTDGGKSMGAVARGELNDGIYIWKVPNTLSTTALVRVLAFGTKGETLALGDSGLFVISAQ